MANEQEQALGREQVDNPTETQTQVSSELSQQQASLILDGQAKVKEPVYQPNTGTQSQVNNNSQQQQSQQDTQQNQQPVNQQESNNQQQSAPADEYIVAVGEQKYQVPQDLYQHIQALQTNAETLANQATAIEEFQANPNEFLKKYASDFVVKQFDTTGYVKNKLDKEFGSEFKFDISRAYEVGTADFNYRVRQDQLIAEANSIVSGAQNEIIESQNKAQQAYNEASEAARVKLGVDENTWKTKVLSVIETTPREGILELIGRSILIEKNTTEYKAGLQNASNVARQVTPISAMSGQGSQQQTQSTDRVKMGGIFGTKEVDSVYNRLPTLN